MLEIMTALAALIGIGNQIDDRFLAEKNKQEIAYFIFGMSNVSFQNFEQNVIRALINPFIKNNNIRLSRILILSLLYTTALIVFIIQKFYSEVELENVYITIMAFIFFIPIFTFISFPFDVWSLLITKKIFFDSPKNSPILLPLCICIDIIISIIPYIITIMILILIFHREIIEAEGVPSSGFISFYVMGIICSIFGSIIISAIQIIFLILDVSLRIILMLTKLNRIIAMKSEIHNSPMTFLAFIFSIPIMLVWYYVMY